MKTMVITHEYPNIAKKKDPKEKGAKTHFHPKLSTAAGWSKHVLDVSLEKLYAMGSSRM